MKRRKDSGFTLIELMIVIAVIGILAVVLIPKVGAVKTSAKSAGIDTNLRTVQALVESRISYWDSTFNQTNIEPEIDALDTSGDVLKNPFVATGDALVTDTVPSDPVAGAIYVEVPDTSANLKTTGIKITGIDKNGKVYNSVTIKP